MRVKGRFLVALCSLVLSGSVAVAADINVMSGGAPKEVLAALTPQFEQATGHRMNFTYIVISAMQQKLNAGEKPDMVLMPVPAIEARVKDGSFRPDAWARLGTVRVAMIVRAGAAKPDISSADAVKRALLAARAVAWQPGGLSGTIFEAVLDKLGIAAEVKAKAKLGAPAAAFVARGEADIATQQISELIAVQGADLVGPLPPELGGTTQFSLGILAEAPQADVAKRFAAFLKSEEASRVIKEKGLTPG